MKFKIILGLMPFFVSCLSAPPAAQWGLSSEKPLVMVGLDPGIFIDKDLSNEVWIPLFGNDMNAVPSEDIRRQTGLGVDEVESVVLVMESSTRPDREISVVIRFRPGVQGWFDRLKEASQLKSRKLGNREVWTVGVTLFLPRGQDLWIVNLSEKGPTNLEQMVDRWYAGAQAPGVPPKSFFLEFNSPQDLLKALPTTFKNFRGLRLAGEFGEGLRTQVALDMGDEKLAQGTTQVLEGLSKAGLGLQMIFQRMKENGDFKAFHLEEFLGPALELLEMKTESQIGVLGTQVVVRTGLNRQQLTTYARALGQALKGISLNRIFDGLLELGRGMGSLSSRPRDIEEPFDRGSQEPEPQVEPQEGPRDGSGNLEDSEEPGETGLKSADPESRKVLRGEKVRKP